MNKKCKIVKIIILLTFLLNITITPIYIQAQQQTKTQNPPEINPERLRVNLTDTIPKEFMHLSQPGVPQQLQFKNMVLELKTSRNMTMSITSDDQVGFQYLSMNMEMNQNMHINTYMAQEPPENIPHPQEGLNKYITMEPNSTEPIRATLRLYVNQEEIPETSSIEEYTWCYWNGTHWDPTPTRYTADGFLETNTTHLSTWTLKEQQKEKPRDMPTPETPGIKAETKAYNYTDVTPSGFRYKMQENTPIMLQFRNSAIYMHATKPIDLEYSAEEQNRNRLIRVEVESDNPLYLRFNLRESKPDEVGLPEKSLGFYCEIEPNQTITMARLGYEVDPIELQSMEMDSERLSWAFWNGTHWQTVESTLTEENVLETDTDHFSIWTIVELEENVVPEEPTEKPTEPVVEPDSEDTNKIPIPTIGIAAGVIVFVIVLMIRKTH